MKYVRKYGEPERFEALVWLSVAAGAGICAITLIIQGLYSDNLFRSMLYSYLSGFWSTVAIIGLFMAWQMRKESIYYVKEVEK